MFTRGKSLSQFQVLWVFDAIKYMRVSILFYTENSTV